MEVNFDFSGIPDLRSQLSDVPDQWREAVVIERTLEDGAARCLDGSRVDFSSGQLL